MIRRHPFLVFLFSISVIVFGLIQFIQSAQFARFFSRAIAVYLPKDSGIDFGFKGIEVQFFPPAIGVSDINLVFSRPKGRVLPGSRLAAKRVNFVFLPIQILRGNIRVNELSLSGADLQLSLMDTASSSKRKAGELTLNWDELFQIRAEAIALVDSRLKIKLFRSEGVDDTANLPLEFGSEIRKIRVAQWMGKGGLGYAIDASLSKIHAITDSIGEVDSEVLVQLGVLTRGRQSAWSVSELQFSSKINAAQALIEEIKVTVPALALESEGLLSGNLLTPGDSPLRFRLKASSDLATMSPRLRATVFAKVPGSVTPTQGKVVASAEVTTQVSRPLAALKATIALEAEGVRAPQLALDSMKIKASLQSPDTGNGSSKNVDWVTAAKRLEFTLVSAVFESSSKEKISKVQFGSGGRIEILPFRSLVRDIGVQPIEIALKDAHIHWLAAPGADIIFPLSFRATGKVSLRRLADAKDAEFELKVPDLFVDRLVLDNQKFEVQKPRTRILDIPRIHLEATAKLNAQRLDEINAQIRLEHSRVAVTGDIDFEEGLSLSAFGRFNLTDIGILAENPIFGQGQVGIRVHGPFDAVVLDFDPEIKNANYLGINLGQVKGRISYVDEASSVYLRKTVAQIQNSKFLVDGVIDLKADTHQAIGVQVQNADVHDLLYAFKDIAAPLWWYPEALRGSVGGEVKISGPLVYSEMTIGGALFGNHWDYYGEKFEAVRAQGGYDHGKYYLSSFKATKKGGRLGGRVSYLNRGKEPGALDWDVKSERLSLSDLDHVANLDVPIRGKVVAFSRGKGILGTIESRTHLDLTSLMVRGLPMEDSWLEVIADRGDIRWTGRGLGSHALFEGIYSTDPAKKSRLRLLLEDCDFSTLILVLNSRLISDPGLIAKVSGEMRMQFDADAPELGTGELFFEKLILGKKGAQIELPVQQRVSVKQGSFKIDQLTVRSKGREAELNLVGRGGQIEGTVKGEVDASIVEFLTSVVHEASGPIHIAMKLGGTLRQPMIQGTANVRDVYAKVQGLDSPIEGIRAEARMNQGSIRIENGQAELAGGKVQGGGKIELYPDRYPEVELHAHVQESKVKVYPFQYVKASGTLGVKGDRLPYLIDGDLRADSGLITEKFSGSGSSGGSLKAARFYPVRSEDEDSTRSKFKLNIRATATHGILIQNDLFDAEGRGDVRIVNTFDAPRVVGSAEIVQGKLMFRDRDFSIQSGAATFDNPTTFNPKFNLTANTELGNTKVQLYVAGTLESMKIDLSSNPAMTQSEIFSLLVQGGNNAEARRFSGTERTTFEAGDIASIILHQWDVARDIKAKTGFEFDIDESVNSKLGNSVLRGGASAYQGPKLSVRRKIGKKLQLSGRTSVGGGAQEQSFQADLQVTPNFSVIGIVDNLGGASEVVNPLSFGFDLKLQRKFK